MEFPKSQLKSAPIKRNLMREEDVEQQEPAQEVPVSTPPPAPVNEPLPVEPEQEQQLTDPKLQMILDKMTELESSVQDLSDNFDQLSSQVEDVKNPNDVNIEDMASLTSGPFDLKISKYWGKKVADFNVNDDAIMNYDRQNQSDEIKNKITNMSDSDVAKSITNF